MNSFMSGFGEELVKEAGIGAVLKRAVGYKGGMSFLQRRRWAKILGVKTNQVEAALLKRKRRKKLRKTVASAGALAGGTALGASLT